MCHQGKSVSVNAKKTLFLILALGLIIRLMAAFVQPAFLDEGFVYQVTREGFQSMVDVLRNDTHAPTYNMIMYPLVRLTGDIFLLRLPAVILSLGTILLSFALSRRFLSERASLAVTAYLSLSYSVWLTDAQLRTYGPITFLIVALLLGFVDIGRNGEPFAGLTWKRGRWLMFFVAALLASTLHVLGTLSIGVLLLFSIALPQRRRLITCFVLAILPTALWFAWSHTTGTMTYTQEATKEFSLQFLNIPLYILNLKTPGEIVGYLNGFLQPGSWISVIAWSYVLANAIIWVVWLVGLKASIHRWGREGWLLGAVFLLPLLAVLVSCILGLQPFAPRYAVPMSLPFILVCAQTFSSHGKMNCWQLALGWTVILSLAFPFCPALWNQYWAPVVGFIDSHARPGDAIGVYNPYAMYSLAMAYDPQGASFKFGYRDEYFVIPVHNPNSDKLPIYPLTMPTLSQMYNQLPADNHLFLVICQREQGDGAISEIPKLYTVLNRQRFFSLTYWADVEVLELARANTTRT